MGNIFKAYDIRGIFPDDLDEDIAYRIGRSFVAHTGARRVVVGRDSRLSSVPLKTELARGITDQGADVIDIGLATTPMTKVVQSMLEEEFAIQVTASHNPKEYGGFKLYKEGGMQLTGVEGIPEIRSLAEKGAFADPASKGKVRKHDALKEYVEHLSSLMDTDVSSLFVVLDASNGPAGRVAERLFDALHMQYSALNFDPDGNFPGHDPNPLHGDAQKQTQEKVVDSGADFGCIMDADADRAIFVDEQGRQVKTDLIHAALSTNYLLHNQGEGILYDCFSSHAVRDAIAGAGGKPLMNRTGAAFMCKRMKDEDLVFGGETSGHYMYRDMAYTDHAMYTLMSVMRLVIHEGKPLSEIVKGFDTYHDSGQVNVPVDDAAEAVRKVKEAFKDLELDETDGVSAELGDDQGTWFIVRPSNTEPLIRLRAESKDEQKMIDLKERILSIVG